MADALILIYFNFIVLLIPAQFLWLMESESVARKSRIKQRGDGLCDSVTSPCHTPGTGGSFTTSELGVCDVSAQNQPGSVCSGFGDEPNQLSLKHETQAENLAAPWGRAL